MVTEFVAVGVREVENIFVLQTTLNATSEGVALDVEIQSGTEALPYIVEQASGTAANAYGGGRCVQEGEGLP